MFKNVTLEISLKPFKRTDSEYIRKVCSGIFRQWQALLENRETISVMLWVGDGSEILDYAGNMDDKFEWCRFIGTANLPYLEKDAPLETSLHKRKQDYMENPPEMTYGILKNIVECIKNEGKKAFPDAKIRVGETFDIGPEFAISDFKYNRHKEICSGSQVDRLGFVDATAKLCADDYHYVAYPDGIPEGTPFGTFFGKQSEHFLRDLGFDYLWLSNGLGFSANPWVKTGKIFDGKAYYPEKLEETKKHVFEFWKLFRSECSLPLETRGTNNSVGIDYASDGVPLYDIYNENLDITAPPNSPWAALNDNYGLEIMGHMTRICELPNEKFPFRYYVHDPWWVNSPWYDRYDGTPCDIYLPMAISRINASGEVESANSLNILSIDNSFGNMPNSCANEPIPHLLKAEKDSADKPALLVWIYPMREYTTSDDALLLKEMNLGDNFICDAINDGLPLCCVASTDSFLKHGPEIYKNSTIITPVPENNAVSEKLKGLAKQGTGILMYGTSAKLNTYENFENLVRIDVEKGTEQMRKAWLKFGYSIEFSKKGDNIKPPTLAIACHDNGFFFSVYNSNTTTDTKFKFPLGAPILCGAETEIINGYSSYRFARAEHRECRIFVNQESGIISCREAAPVNARFRRAIKITGLKDATVSLCSENGCECAVSVSKGMDATPEFDNRFKLVKDEKHGEILKGENVSGDIYFLIGHKNTRQ
ncbi:MAG: hypothetical protein IJN39_00295 [Clostridia bacterium]|nr:hypothetical protein [Clostridia bacterium]